MYGSRPAPARVLPAARQGRRLRTAARSLVRDGKGRKDRVTVLPARLVAAPAPAPRARRAPAPAPTSRAEPASSRCPTPSTASTRTPAASGPGSGSSPPTASTSTRRPARRRRHHLHETVAPARVRGRRARGPARQAGHLPHPAPLLRHPPARDRLRHPHHPGAARPLRRRHHHDLHPRPQPRRPRRPAAPSTPRMTSVRLSNYPDKDIFLHDEQDTREPSPVSTFRPPHLSLPLEFVYPIISPHTEC